jgi:hypothetical protein
MQVVLGENAPRRDDPRSFAIDREHACSDQVSRPVNGLAAEPRDRLSADKSIGAQVINV